MRLPHVAAAASFLQLLAPAQNSLPVVTLHGPQSWTLELGAVWADPGANCTDPEDGSLPVATPILESTALEGVWYLPYSCTDVAGDSQRALRHVVVVDTTPPEIALLGRAELEIGQGSLWQDPGASCDNPGRGALSTLPVDAGAFYEGGWLRTASNTVDTARVGTYRIDYSCQDASRNSATVSRVVRVLDWTPPTLSLRGASLARVRVGGVWHDPGAACVDAIDGDLPVTIRGAAPEGRQAAVAVHHVTYDCMDRSGNAAVPVHRTLQVAAAARHWRIRPVGVPGVDWVSADWAVRNIVFHEDAACSMGSALRVSPMGSRRVQANGISWSSPGGATRRADIAFAKWTPMGVVVDANARSWQSGHPCDTTRDCHVGFSFEEPVTVSCVSLEQGTAPGTWSGGLQLQWREADSGPFRDFVRIHRFLSGGPVQLRRSCPAECPSCGAEGLTVHPCAAY